MLKIFLYPIIILHYIYFMRASEFTRTLIREDISEMSRRYRINNHCLAYWLVNYSPYRNLFYARIPSSRRLSYILPQYPLFSISSKEGIGGGAFVLNHPYATIINAKSIGNNFTCCHLTTIGNAIHGRNDLVPTIGNNVSVGANVTIIGDITIGDNVIIGAGSVVVKDVPSNTVIAGCPARVINQI